MQKHEEEEDAVRMAERLVYGWPGQESEPSGVASVGRFVKSHPLDFPMGIGDLLVLGICLKSVRRRFPLKSGCSTCSVTGRGILLVGFAVSEWCGPW